MPGTVTRLGRRWSGGGRPFFRNLALLSGGQLASKLIGFLAFAVLARRLAPEDYGAVEYVVGLSVFFATLVDCGLGTVGVRRIARDSNALPGLAVQVPAMRLAIALLSVPLMVLVAGPATHGPATQGLVGLFALSLLAAPWRQVWLLQATERMGEAAVAQVLRTLVFALVASSLAVWLVSHTLAVRAAARMPAFAMALAPGAQAALIIGAIHWVGRHDWSNAVGVLGFALVAPLVDRRLLPAVTRLGVARLDRSAVAESTA